MYKIEINGARPLEGKVYIHGAKNAVLPILAAAILGEGESVIQGCPALEDVNSAIGILEYIGCRIRREGDTVGVNASAIRESSVPELLMHKMRSSITFLGPLAARFGKAEMSLPGGCELGARPIDLHIAALRKLGMEIECFGDRITAKRGDLHGTGIHLDFPSVGATENIMMASALAEGETVIKNAAKEPEIEDLQKFLTAMGADIKGAGTDEIRIVGVGKLHGAVHSVIPDRIVAATYLCAAAITGGRIELTGVEPGHVGAIIKTLRDTGALVDCGEQSISLRTGEKIGAVKLLRTMPYPGFPTDAQALFTALLAVGDGTSVIEENIFENRFWHCAALERMGADITTRGRLAVIRGVKKLHGACVEATELRGGAALILAGLSAEGKTVIDGTAHIDRGYASIIEDMQALGADIRKG